MYFRLSVITTVPDERHDTDIDMAAGQLSFEMFSETGKVVPVIAYPNDTHDGPVLLFKRMDRVAVRRLKGARS